MACILLISKSLETRDRERLDNRVVVNKVNMWRYM